MQVPEVRQKATKTNNKEDYEGDLISQLPDGIPVAILSKLPITDAARTCILSRKWRYMWTFFLGAWNLVKVQKLELYFGHTFEYVLPLHLFKLASFNSLQVLRLKFITLTKEMLEIWSLVTCVDDGITLSVCALLLKASPSLWRFTVKMLNTKPLLEKNANLQWNINTVSRSWNWFETIGGSTSKVGIVRKTECVLGD
ncbi:hypothetical protein VNO78_24058 [Psophocarpus tetragonolobus]|uniref:F-box domain-containing protein n=1 Tax=Psophocarpus tetragonolobus TaxID=3891 RepID=A0AAN9S4R2_PSOTE